MRPAGDDLAQGDGGAAAGDAVDGEDRPGDPVQVADVFAATCVRMLTSPGSGAHRDDFWHRQEGGVGLADPQGSVVLVPSTRTGAGGCGITPADSTRLWRHSQYRFLHSWPAGWTGRGEM